MFQKAAQFARRKTAWVALAGIVVLGMVAYAPSLGYPYLQDSVAAVERNPVVERGSVGEIFRSDYWKETISSARTLYRPVTVLSFALERKLTGEPDPFASHLVNLLLHLANAALIFFYCRRLGGSAWLALIAAWVFTVQPLLLQGVINVVGRGDLLALLFGLLAMLAMTKTGAWRGSAAPSAGRARLAAWAAAIFLFLALGSKEIAVAIPLLVLIQEALFRRDTLFRRAAALAPSLLAVIIFIDLRTRALGVFPGLQVVPREDNVLVGLAGIERWSTALAMAARYAGLLFFPARLSPDYSGTVIEVRTTFFQLAPLLGALFLAGCLALALLPWLRRSAGEGGDDLSGFVTVVSMGAWIFLLPYLAVGNLLVLNAAGFAERLLYLPAAGFCMVLAAALAALAGRVPAARPVIALLLGVALIAGVAQVRAEGRMWETRRAFWDHALRNTPRSLRATVARAHDHRRAGETEQASALFRRCVELAPDDPGAWSDLGIYLRASGQAELAEEALRRAVDLDPSRGEAWAALGALWRRGGRTAEAERALRKALRWRPDMISTAAELAGLLFDSGRYAEAAHYYRGCVGRGRRDLVDEMERAEALARYGR